MHVIYTKMHDIHSECRAHATKEDGTCMCMRSTVINPKYNVHKRIVRRVFILNTDTINAIHLF